MIPICKSIISGMPIINFACFVLCLIESIVTNIQSEPPKADISSNVASGTRLTPGFFEMTLSYTVTTSATTEMRAK